MNNYDVAKQVVSYFDKKTKTALTKDLWNILLAASDTALEQVITQEYLFEMKNEHHFLCYVYQLWHEQFLKVSRIHKKNDLVKRIAGIKVPMSQKDVAAGLELFKEINALNVFEAINPPLFLNI